MKRIHPTTTLSVVLNLAALTCFVFGFQIPAIILSVIGFFCAVREISKYTTWYQFITLLLSGLLAGSFVDYPFQHFPFLTVSLFFAGLAAVIRIAFFRTFSYTGYSWFEPSATAISIIFYLLSILIPDFNWTPLITIPIILFVIIFSWGTYKDKNQLLKNSKGGYKVKIGKEADNFELPDQDGNLTRLSDYKNKRHVLLIFVRGDWCPGCHMMLRTYEKNNKKFQSKNVLVMAIGPDPVGVNREMVEKLGVDFKVLADEGQRTAMTYGVQLKEYDNDFAEKYEEGIPLPASFLIDKSGVVRYVSRPDKVGEFLNPSLIFPIVEKLDTNDRSFRNGVQAEEPSAKEKVSKEELKNHESVIASLKKELNNYESIIDQANDTVIVIDIVDGKIHQSNPSAAKLLGYSKEELESISLFDLHPKEMLDQSSRIVADVWEKGGLIYKDIPFITKTNEIVPVECSAKVAPFAGRPAIVIYARDIRERLRLEREINEQRRVIDERNKDIRDSIEYSKRIQRSFLIEKEKLKEFAPDSFIFFQPRDVVSGDFYWFNNHVLKQDIDSSSGHKYPAGSQVLMVAAVDCTGHGVPGAFMSIIGNALLNQAWADNAIFGPANTLNYIDTELKRSLNKNSEDKPLRDGMDIALCFIDLKEKYLEYAGANNPLYIVRNGEMIVINADKQPITASTEYIPKPFTTRPFQLQTNDCIYLFTDGFADQFGGENGKKFMYKRFKETLVEIHTKSMSEQKELLHKTFQDWKGDLEQVDDVLVIGIKIK